jgi:hypothetical protein
MYIDLRNYNVNSNSMQMEKAASVCLCNYIAVAYIITKQNVIAGTTISQMLASS